MTTIPMRMTLIAAALACLFAAGCGATAVQRFGADGEPEYWLDCSNKTMGPCYKKALSLCPQGYFLVKEVETPQGSTSGSVWGKLKHVGGQKSDQEIKWKNHLVIRCK